MTKTTIHPETLEQLKGTLPLLEKLAGLETHDQEKIDAAVNELRGNFPGLDDLTLSAFAAYIAKGYVEDIAEGDPFVYGSAIAYSVMALDLAKEIR